MSGETDICVLTSNPSFSARLKEEGDLCKINFPFIQVVYPVVLTSVLGLGSRQMRL